MPRQGWALSPVEIEALKPSLRMSFQAVAGSLPRGAGGMGAGPPKIFRASPSSTDSFTTGLIFAFALSLGEFGATITFVSDIRGEKMNQSILDEYFSIEIPL